MLRAIFFYISLFLSSYSHGTLCKTAHSESILTENSLIAPPITAEELATLYKDHISIKTHFDPTQEGPILAKIDLEGFSFPQNLHRTDDWKDPGSYNSNRISWETWRRSGHLGEETLISLLKANVKSGRILTALRPRSHLSTPRDVVSFNIQFEIKFDKLFVYYVTEIANHSNSRSLTMTVFDLKTKVAENIFTEEIYRKEFLTNNRIANNEPGPTFTITNDRVYHYPTSGRVIFIYDLKNGSVKQVNTLTTSKAILYDYFRDPEGRGKYIIYRNHFGILTKLDTRTGIVYNYASNIPYWAL